MKYVATISWQKKPEEAFTDNKYSRAHHWRFDGGAEVYASASPDIVPLPYSDAAGVDPEEAFVASLSSCHMLFFLSFAAAKNFTILSYEDNAEGVMGKNTENRTAMTEVTLKPRVQFGGDNIPTAEQIDALHHRSHKACFIANSVKTKVTVVPVND
ncbi:MAG: OsmC family protein [Calditrichia bacterium]